MTLPLKFIEKVHNYEITLDEATEKQIELKILINKLNKHYNPRIPKKAKEKNRVLESAKKLSDAMILLIFLKKEFFRIKIMHLKQKKKNQKKNQKKTSWKK